MICENFVDRQWLKTAERKAKEVESFKRREARAKEEVKRMEEKIELTDEMVDEVFQNICNDENDDDFIPSAAVREGEEEEEEAEKENEKKRRRLSNSLTQSAGSEIPERFRHIRNSIRKVKL